MIQYNTKNWFGFLLKNWDKHMEGMLISMLTFGTFTFALVYVQQRYEFLNYKEPTVFITVLGLVVGLLLVFRTNTAYDRWWEGRKQLGKLINYSRDTASKYHAFLPNDKLTPAFQSIIPAFAWAMKEHLREQDYALADQHIHPDLRAGFDKAAHKPNYLLFELNKFHYQFIKEGIITNEQLIILETNVTALANILGACERIRFTPIPFAYALHLKRILFIYIFTLPFAFVKQMGYWTIPLVLLIFYVMIGIELIGEEIEDPFGTDENDLPFDEIQEKIKNNVEEIFVME